MHLELIFSHNTNGINKIVSKIRKIERSTSRKIALIADLQGVKLRVGKIKDDNQKIKYNQKYIFDSKKETGDNSRINFPYPKILKKLKKGNKILIDDGKFVFIVISKKGLAVTTICKSQNCFVKSNKSIHIPNFDISFNKLTIKDKKDIKTAIKLGCTPSTVFGMQKHLRFSLCTSWPTFALESSAGEKMF